MLIPCYKIQLVYTGSGTGRWLNSE